MWLVQFVQRLAERSSFFLRNSLSIANHVAMRTIITNCFEVIIFYDRSILLLKPWHLCKISRFSEVWNKTIQDENKFKWIEFVLYYNRMLVLKKMKNTLGIRKFLFWISFQYTFIIKYENVKRIIIVNLK